MTLAYHQKIPDASGLPLKERCTVLSEIGVEGSNFIYLGRNKFDDYYNDNGHSYTYKQKLNEVYQWRNGVFSRHRDASKMRPLSQEELDQLGKAPSEDGLVMEFRVSPYIQIPRD